MDGGNNSLNQTCSHGPPSNHRPLRFFLNKEKTAFSCGWTTLSSALRGGLDGATFLFAVLSFCLTLVQKNCLSHVINILFLCLAAGFSYISYTDAVNLRDSFFWCEKGMPGMIFANELHKVSCSYGWLFVTNLCEILMVIELILLCAFTCYFLCLEKKTSRGRVTKVKFVKRPVKTEKSGLIVEDRESDDEDSCSSDPIVFPDKEKASREYGTSETAVVIECDSTLEPEIIDFEQVQSQDPGKINQ